MKILFDAFWWTDGPISNQRVMKAFVRTWLTDFPEDTVHIVVPGKSVEVARRDLPASVTVHGTPVPQHGISTALYLPLLAARLKPDRVLTQNFAGIWGKRFDVFVHDALFVDNPQWFTWPERRYFGFMRATWRRARRVLASSGTEALRLQRVMKSAQTPAAVGLAVDGSLTEATPSRPDGVPDDLPFMLNVGRLNVRKNTTYVIDACQRAGVISPEAPLLIVGEPDGAAADAGYDKSLVASGAVRFLGRISDAELAWLYAKASSFIFLSRDEGFGLPPLEAASFGCPLFVSDVPIMREVTQALGAVYLPLDDLDRAANLLREAVPGLRRTPRRLGYSWSTTVKKIREELLA